MGLPLQRMPLKQRDHFHHPFHRIQAKVRHGAVGTASMQRNPQPQCSFVANSNPAACRLGNHQPVQLLQVMLLRIVPGPAAVDLLSGCRQHNQIPAQPDALLMQ
ncbi:hypothetical protein D3C71_1911580 [compost metagenome]